MTGAKEAEDFIRAQEQEILYLQARVKQLEDGLRRMVTCGNTKTSAMAWNILNQATELPEKADAIRVAREIKI